METSNHDDVKSVEAASTSSAAQATEVQQTNTETSAATTDVNKEPSLQDVVKSVLEKHDLSKDSEKKDKESPVQELNKTEEKPKESEVPEAKQDEQKKDDKVEPKAPVTDDEIKKFSPRAQERIRELVETNKTLSQWETKAKEFEPIVQRMQGIETYCQTNNVSPEDFNQALELVALLRKNPEQGIAKMEEQVVAFKQSLGQMLPSDLQAEVAEGVLDPKRAKEIATLRLQQKQLTEQQQRSTQAQQANVQRELNTTLEGWATSRKATDPDFKPKVNGSPDGKYELTMLKFGQLWNSTPVFSVSEAVGLLERAYNDANATVKGFMPKPAAKPRHVSSPSSAPAKQENIDTSKPGWARKVAAQTLASR